MTLRQRLSLSIFTILLLLSINIVTYFWGNHSRDTAVAQLMQSINGQLYVNAFKNDLVEINNELSFQSHNFQALNPNDSQLLRIIEKLNSAEQNLISLGNYNDDFPGDYNRINYDYYRLLDYWHNLLNKKSSAELQQFEREKLYLSIVDRLIRMNLMAKKQGATYQQLIHDTISTTSKINVTVFLISILITAATGFLLLRYTNANLTSLKEGTVRFGSGELDYHIPVLAEDEFGELAGAFNAMASELKQAMTEVRQAKEEAVEASAAKSGFLTSVSHELRTPLNAIIGYSEMLMEDLEVEDTVRREDINSDVEKILMSGKHLLNLINNVLDLSKIETGKMTVHFELFSVQQLLKELMAAVAPLAEKNFNVVECHVDPNLPELYSDLTKCRQMLLNLLSNACKFTERGKISLTAEYLPNDRVIRFEVADTGIGIPEQMQDKIFEAFIQADSSTSRHYGGTGLGLAICKEFAELLHGSISLISEPNKGSKFTLILPIGDQQRKPGPDITREIPTSQSAANSHQQSILVIDDDPVQLSLINHYLQDQHYKPLLADSGQKGLEMAKTNRPDAILLDLLLPEPEGWSVFDTLKESTITRDIPIIVISNPDSHDSVGPPETEAFLSKPINPEQLMQLLHTILIKRTSVTH